MIMQRRSGLRTVILLLMFCILLSACKEATPPPPTETAVSHTATFTESATLSPTQTLTMSPTVTTTPTPSPTITPSPTPTKRWDNWSLSLTPLPDISEAISINTTSLVQPLAVWGTGDANQIRISPDGQILAVATNIGAYLYDTLTYEQRAILQTPFAVQKISFSPDNQLIALGQHPGTIDVIAQQDMALVTRLAISGPEVHAESLNSVSFSPDSTRLTSVIESQDQLHIRQWDTSTWQTISAFSIDNGTAAYINEDANLIGAISGNTLSLHSLTFIEDNKTLSLPSISQPLFWETFSRYGGQVEPSSDGSFLLINSGNTIVHWKIIKDNITYHLDDYPDRLQDPCYDAPATCQNENGGYSWQCSQSEPLSPIIMTALTPDNIMMLVSLREGRSEFRRVVDGILEWEIDTSFLDIAFSPGGEFFFGLRPDGTIEKRTTLDGSLLDLFDRHPSSLSGLDFSPDGSVLAAGFDDGWIRVYSSVNGQMLGVLTGRAKSLKFSPDGRLLAAGLHNGTVRIFELEEGQFYDLSNGHEDTVTDLDFSLNGQQLLTGSKDCTASLWEVTERYRIFNLTPNRQDPFQITSLALSGDQGRQFYSGNHSGIYIMDNTRLQDIILPSEDGFKDLALSPEGRLIAVTGTGTWLTPISSGDIPSTSRPLNSEDEGYAITFTPTGSLLIRATDHNLEFWSVKMGKMLSSIPLNLSRLTGVRKVELVVSPDGSLIAVGSGDSLIKIYGIPSNNPE